MSTSIKKPRKIQSILVIGRQYWLRRQGHTVQSATVYVNGKEVAKLPPQSGYEQQFAYDALKLLELGDHRNQQSPYAYCYERGIHFESVLINVKQKSDL